MKFLGSKMTAFVESAVFLTDLKKVEVDRLNYFNINNSACMLPGIVISAILIFLFII